MKSLYKISKIFVTCAACLSLTLACSPFGAQSTTVDEPVSVPSATVMVKPTASYTPRPANTARPTNTSGPTNTPQPPSCYKWDQITLDMVGEVVCVYGVTYSVNTDHLTGQTRIDFSPEENSFFLIDSVHYYPELTGRYCIMVIDDKVEVFDGKIPFMTIHGKLYECESWMLE